MKNKTKKYWLGFLAAIVVVLVILSAIVVNRIIRYPKPCPNCAQLNVPLLSPSGNYTLVVEMKMAGVHDLYRVAKVIDNRTQEEKGLPYTEEAERYKSALMWDNLDNVWSYSADLGTYMYVIQGDRWIKKQASTYPMTGMCPSKEFIQIMYKGEERFRECL